MSTSQPAVQEGLSIQGLTPFLISITVCAPLWGVTIAQAAAYFRTYQNDNKFFKILVGFSVYGSTFRVIALSNALRRVLSTAQLVTLAYTVYFWMIICRDPVNYKFIGVLVQSLVVVPAFTTYFLTTLVQCFYAMRVWFVNGRKLWLVVMIVILSVTQLIGRYALLSYIYALCSLSSSISYGKNFRIDVNNITALYCNFNYVSGSIELGSSMACDILITGSLWWYLRKGKGSMVFTRTRVAIDTLILHAVNIGLLTNLVTLANLVTWLATPESDSTWAVFHFALGKVYVNSMLVSLNARERIRNNLNAEPSVVYLQRSTFNIDIATHNVGGD